MMHFNHTKFKRDIIVVIIILVMPFLFFLYNLSPENGKYWDLKFLSIYSGINWDIDFFAWQLFVKIYTILIISLWFLTCKNMWRYALFVPLTIEVYKLMSVLNEAYNFIEFLTVTKTFPLAFLYSLILIYVSKILKYYSTSKQFSVQLNEEIDELAAKVSNFKIKNYEIFKYELEELRKEKNYLDNKDYLAKLMALNDRIIC